jgi:tetratricopeptide (TPR) repeat protein
MRHAVAILVADDLIMASDQDDLDLAEELLQAGDLTFAAFRFRRSLAPLDGVPAAGQIARSLVGLGRIAYLRGDAARALRYAEEALRHDSSSRGARLLMADSTSRRQPPAAHTAWSREARLFPA